MLAVRNLRISFVGLEGVAHVLNGVDLHVGRGEKVGLVGETGCGKSITVKAVMDILKQPPARIDSGEIWFQGRDLLRLDPSARRVLRARSMAMIFQDPMASLNPVFTVGQQLEEVIWWRRWPESGPLEYWLRRRRRDLRGEVRAMALNALAQVQFPDPERVYRSYPFQLSGGMRQRVLIAMALVMEPELIIADEPGTALDVTTQDQILRLLDRLVAEKQTALLIITHHLGVVRQLTDRVYVMYAGEVVEEGATADLFRNPSHPYTQGLLRSVPRLTGEGLGAGIDGMIPDYYAPPPGCRFAPRCAYATERCQQRPPLVPVGDGKEGHRAACVLYAQSSDGLAPLRGGGGAPHA